MNDWTLPALRSLGNLADVRPTVVIDSREQTPLHFERLSSVTGTLTSGDYSFVGGEEHFAIERKSIPDLVSCVTSQRDRIERELTRLRGYQFSRLLVVGTRRDIEEHNYRSATAPKAVLHSLASWEAQFIPVVFSATPAAAAELVESWAYWFSRGVVEAANNLLRGHKRIQSAAPAASTEVQA